MTRTRKARAVEQEPAGPFARGGLTKAEQTLRTRRLIVETGIRCLAEAGYAQTTMLLIAREAGISRGPLHYHFEDRNALMAAIAEALPTSASRTVLDRLSRPTGIGERLEAVIDLALEEHLGPHHFAATELLLAARNDPDLFQAIRPHFQQSEALMDQWWADYLSLLRWPRRTLVAFRHVSVACLRGLALDHVLHQDEESHKAALELFRELFLTFARTAR